MRGKTGDADEPLRPPWWQRQLSLFVWRLMSLPPVQLSLWRLERNWRLLLAVSSGILITVVLICTVPLYAGLVLNVSLQQQLDSQAPLDRNVEATMDLAPLSNLFVRDTLSETSFYASQYLQQFAPANFWYFAITNSYAPTAVNGQALSDRLRSALENVAIRPYILDNSQALSHLRIMSGHFLQPTAFNQPPQIMVTPELGLHPGDTLTIHYTGGGKKLLSLTMTVAGIWFPKSLDDPYWNGNSAYFEPSTSCAPHCATVTPIFFDVDTFLNDFSFDPASSIPVPFTGATLHYVAFTNSAQVTTSNLTSIQTGIQAFKTLLPTAVAATNLFVYTRLNSLLASFQAQLGTFIQPLYIVVAQIVGLALLFVIAMAFLLVEDQAGDIATLKSRGASLMQLLLSYALPGLVMVLAAAYVGPFLAEGLSLAAVLLFLPGAHSVLLNILTSGNLPRIISPQLAFRPALAGAFVGLVTLTCALWLAARVDILAFRREAGRGGTVLPVWKRLYLDLVLILFSGLGYLELGQFGTLPVRQLLVGQTGTISLSGSDPLQLAAPALLLFGGGLLVLRLFPLASRGAAWIASRARGAISMLAFAQLARNAQQFSRLALLLTLAVGLGVFALTFQSSISANALAQARFLAGSDQRVILNNSSALTAPLEKQFAALPGVRGITPAYRTVITTNTGDQVGMLAIDPSTFGQVAYWRADYAQRPLGSLLAAMRSHQQGAAAGDQQHPIWALVDTAFAARYALEPGVVFTLPLISGSSDAFYFRVGAVVNNLPTLGNTSFTGIISISLQDLAHALDRALAEGTYSSYYGPNEFWLRTDGNPLNDARRTLALRNPSLLVASTIDAQTLETQAADDPLSAGMATLLLLGACIAVLLALLGSVIQSNVATKQRLIQFAILRTLGGQERQLVRLLLGQQLLVYAFSLLSGIALGVILSTATLPFLQFSTATIDTAQTHVPPYLLSFNPAGMLLFGAALVLVFMLALHVGVQVAQRSGLGKALRIGEE